MARGPAETSYMAECFWPDVREAAVQQAAERLRLSTGELRSAGTVVELTGTILVPGDEVVFYLFTGSAEAVREACEQAQIPFERIVESVHARLAPAMPRSAAPCDQEQSESHAVSKRQERR
jgi:hypothetical protein